MNSVNHVHKNEKRLCIECGTELFGRSDKKFCCDMCRNIYNNRRYCHNDSEIKRINSILAKNKRILELFIRLGYSNLKRNILEEEHFNFQYFTSIKKRRFGKIYFYCYNFLYHISNKDIVYFSKTGNNS